MTALFIVILSAVISYLGIEVFRRRSLARNWFDVPNERSSHDRPTPRGGGLTIAAICLLSYAGISAIYPGTLSWGYFFGAILIATVSWLDDLYSIAFGWRLLVHFGSAFLVVASSGYWQNIEIPGLFSISLGYMGPVITVIWIVWVINAYNFMDGIDGIAGLQALVTSAAWASVSWFAGAEGNFLYAIVIFGACAGFLAHNWSPARVFMGDVGSAFLGFTFAAMPLLFVRSDWPSPGLLPFAAIFFLWPFVFDPVLTLIRRLVRREAIWTPHREHLYQKLVIAGFRHGPVAAAYGVFAAISADIALFAMTHPGNLSLILISLVLVLTMVFVVIVSIRTRTTSHKQNVP